jgi:lipoprotein-anchoring transpeptidase ErfK/SrfK
MNNIKSSSKRHGIFNRLVGLLIIISLLFLTGCSVKASTGSAESELSGTAPSKIAETDTAAAGSTGSSSGENSSGENVAANDSQGKNNTKDTTAASEVGQDKDSATDETTAGTNSDGQSSDSQNTGDSQSSNNPDGTTGQKDPAGSEGQDIKITPKAPEISLQVISGPEYAQENQVCFYRVRANVIGEPFPQIKFNKDDSNSAWGLNVAQVNLTQGQSFTLVCEAVNSQGSAAAEISLNWVDNQNSSGESGTDETAPQIVVDYTDTANFLIDVNLTAQQVTVLYKNVAIKNMACSGGKPETPTPLGTYTTNQKIYYAWIPKFAMGAYYWTRFYGPYLFHSVPYDSSGNMLIEELNKIGSPVSHGCIRLVLEDAKWLYETLPLGIKINIHN